MIEAIAGGATSGFVLSLMLGTVFFALIQHSIDYGFVTGIYIATGVIISDLIFISLALFGTSMVPAIEAHQNTIRITGAILLLILGIAAWRPQPYKENQVVSARGSIVYYLSKGFLLNALNPVNFFAWVSIATYLKGALHYTLTHQVVYFASCLGAIFFTECGISFSASRLRKYLSPSVIVWVNRVAGSVFIVTAWVVIWPVMVHLLGITP